MNSRAILQLEELETAGNPFNYIELEYHWYRQPGYREIGRVKSIEHYDTAALVYTAKSGDSILGVFYLGPTGSLRGVTCLPAAAVKVIERKLTVKRDDKKE